MGLTGSASGDVTKSMSCRSYLLPNMNQVTPKMREFAACLIEHETGSAADPRTENEATLVVLEKLRPQLEELMGNTGYRALLMNALARTKGEAPGLSDAGMNQDVSLDGLDESFPLTAPGHSADGGTVMLAWFFELLASFLGELLTFQLALEVWPDLSLKKCFSTEAKS